MGMLAGLANSSFSHPTVAKKARSFAGCQVSGLCHLTAEGAIFFSADFFAAELLVYLFAAPL